MRCETVDVRVLGMVCGAGGNNARLYKLLAGHSSLPEGGWLELEYVQGCSIKKSIKKESGRRLTTTHVGRIEDGEEKAERDP